MKQKLEKSEDKGHKSRLIDRIGFPLQSAHESDKSYQRRLNEYQVQIGKWIDYRNGKN